MSFKTADLCDEYSTSLQIAEPGFLDFGGNRVFGGPISTVKCFEDNSLVREQLSQPGDGRVLVVDAGGSKRCAMLGDMLAAKGVDNGWAGVVMFGLIRDSEARRWRSRQRRSLSRRGFPPRGIPVRRS